LISGREMCAGAGELAVAAEGGGTGALAAPADAGTDTEEEEGSVRACFVPTAGGGEATHIHRIYTHVNHEIKKHAIIMTRCHRALHTSEFTVALPYPPLIHGAAAATSATVPAHGVLSEPERLLEGGLGALELVQLEVGESDGGSSV
jgi:hypothetical protein